MKTKTKNRIRFLSFSLAALFMFTGCRADAPAPSPTPTPSAQLRGSLKVVYFSEQQFMREYGDSFKKKFPNLTIQVVPMMQNSGGNSVPLQIDAILEKKPDLIYGPNLVMESNKSGKLLDLSVMMKLDNFDLSVFSPAAVDAMKTLGDGKLVALSPSFQSMALYYNKDLFDRLKLPYPQNDMSWQSILQLARKIARTENDKPVYGLSYSFPTVLQRFYTSGVGAVSSISEDGRKAYYTAASYSAAVNAVFDAFKSGAFYLPPEKPVASASPVELVKRNKFIAGEAAMAIDNPGLIMSMRQAANLGISSFTWDMVTEPINPEKPGESQSVGVLDVFGIVSDSPNRQAAWAFLKYLTGPEVAVELPKTKPYVLSIRNDAEKTIDGRKLDPFYAHRPVQIRPNPLSQEVNQQVSTINNEQFTEMLYGRVSVSAGLQSMQERVQQLLDQENAKKK